MPKVGSGTAKGGIRNSQGRDQEQPMAGLGTDKGGIGSRQGWDQEQPMAGSGTANGRVSTSPRSLFKSAALLFIL